VFTGIWRAGTVTTNAPQTLEIRAKVLSTTTQTNLATITKGDQFDPDPTNDHAFANLTPQQSDLALTKSVNDTAPNVGDTITFTITLTNNGPDAATNALVTDLLPAGLSFVSATPSQGSYTAATGIWSAGTIATTTPQTLQIQARVVGSTTQTNTATITHSDQFDPDTTNNFASASETPQHADLRISKAVNDAKPNVGDLITFTLTLANLGPDPATNVQVTDLIPTGLSFVAATPSQGNYDNISGIWTIGAVSTAIPQTLQIQATVVSPTAQTNTASISHSDQFDPNSANNSDSATATPQRADLQLSKSVNNARPNVGDVITYTVTLTDKGPDSATNVQVTDVLPAGLSFVSAIPSQGGYDSASGVWTVGTVTTTTPQTLQIKAEVISPGPQTNTASITNSDQFDPNTANNTASTTQSPQQSDLQLTKAVSNGTPNVGDTITFTVRLTNNGPDTATNVQVTDFLPAGLVFVSATPSQGAYSAVSGLWSVGAISITGAPTLLIRAKVVSPNTQTNTATITGSDQFDPDTSNNTANVTETPQQADLVLAKTVDNASPNVGDTVTFLVTLTNIGPDPASNVQVTDLLPAGLNFVSATPSQGTYSTISGIWSAGTITTSTPQTLQLRAKVVDSTAQTNAAMISHSDQFDPDTTNNSASATASPQQADLVVTKTIDDARPNVGDTITFAVTVTNLGADTATNVMLTDVLPAGLVFVSATPSQGSYNDTSGVWTVGTVTTTTPQTLLIQATVASPAAQTNTAEITHSDQFDPNPANDSAAATATPQQADLQLSKTVDIPRPNVGDTVTYTLTVTNNGPDDATNVTVHDNIPPELSFQSSSGDGRGYDPATGIWDVGTVPTGTSLTLILTYLVISPNLEVNTATISHSDQFDPNTANNSNSATVVPQQSDLALSKTVDNPRPNVGDIITFTVTLTNTGFSDASHVQVRDMLPSGLTLVSATPGQGTYTNGVWNVGSLANGAQTILTIRARVVSPNPKTNTATISHADQFDPDVGNNTASATTTPQRADLVLAKTVDHSRPNVGDIVTFTVTIRNAGPDDATNVIVNDTIPAGLSLISATPSQGSYSGGVWTVGTVSPSAAQTLTITAEVISPNPQTNTVFVRHSDQFDPNVINNAALATVRPQRADLAVAKTVNHPAPNVGDTISFVVTLTNKGPDAATDVSVTDLLPAGLNFISAIPSLGSYDSATGLWTVAKLAAGGRATLTLNAEVISPSAQTNTATITSADQFDPNTNNNSASATQTPQQADLALAKSVSNATPNVGDTVSFTIQVTNHGPNAATNIRIGDQLPVGLAFVSATATSGLYSSATGVWTLSTVAAATTQTLRIQARVLSPLPQTNTATVLGADQFDPDQTNNSASASETPQQSDLQVSKVVSNSEPNVGDVISYTITVTNNGPDPATNVRLLDHLPAGLAFVSATPTQGSYNSITGIWTVGTVDTVTPQDLTLQVRVLSPQSFSNTARVAHSDQFDPDSTNNTASSTTTPQQADLNIAKTVDNPAPRVGDTITFTVTLTNLGPNVATDVLVSDQLPAGLTFVSATPSAGNYDSSTGIWNVGTVTSGTPQTLLLSAVVSAQGAHTNTAKITGADQFDPDAANNAASAATTARLPAADIILSKTVNQPQAFVGSDVTYSFIIRNLGPDDATNVVLNDSFPAGLLIVSANSPSQGTYDPVAGIWTVGTLSSGAFATLVVTARVATTGSIVNSARATGNEFDPVLANNVSRVTLVGLSPPPIVSKRLFLASAH
jgi:uncharacterized repeat protein (TIGR01451 family)